jgi:hypothetical protein
LGLFWCLNGTVNQATTSNLKDDIMTKQAPMVGAPGPELKILPISDSADDGESYGHEGELIWHQ